MQRVSTVGTFLYSTDLLLQSGNFCMQTFEVEGAWPQVWFNRDIGYFQNSNLWLVCTISINSKVTPTNDINYNCHIKAVALV